MTIDAMEKVIIGGDLAVLSSSERVYYYNKVCESLGLNPLTKPFQYILLDDGKGGKKLTFYATKDCTEQLRKINGVSVSIVSREFKDDLYIITARAIDNTGRTDESIGAVSLKCRKLNKETKKYTYYDAQGDIKANLLMKSETKAKRRVTLSICGLGMLDESETDSIPHAKVVSEPELNLLDKSKVELLDELNVLIDIHSIPSETINKWLEWGCVFDLSDLECDKISKLIIGINKRYSQLEVKNG